RRLLAVERAQHAAEFRHRASPHAERAVPAGPADDPAQPAHLLLADLDRIEAPACDVQRLAARFAERVARAAEDLRPFLGEEARTGVAAVFFVAEDREHERRSEEHTSELQSRENLVCRLLLENKKSLRVTDASPPF